MQPNLGLQGYDFKFLPRKSLVTNCNSILSKNFLRFLVDSNDVKYPLTHKYINAFIYMNDFTIMLKLKNIFQISNGIHIS